MPAAYPSRLPLPPVPQCSCIPRFPHHWFYLHYKIYPQKFGKKQPPSPNPMLIIWRRFLMRRRYFAMEQENRILTHIKKFMVISNYVKNKGVLNGYIYHFPAFRTTYISHFCISFLQLISIITILGFFSLEVNRLYRSKV